MCITEWPCTGVMVLRQSQTHSRYLNPFQILLSRMLIIVTVGFQNETSYMHHVLSNNKMIIINTLPIRNCKKMLKSYGSWPEIALTCRVKWSIYINNHRNMFLESSRKWRQNVFKKGMFRVLTLGVKKLNTCVWHTPFSLWKC